MVRSQLALLRSALPSHMMIIFFYNIRWKLPAELFNDDIKWLFLIENHSSLFFAHQKVARANSKKRF